MLCVFFVKQKTAYDMRISDWSSDVCSSDLSQRRDQRRRAPGRQRRSDRSVVRKGRKLMRFKLTPYAQNSLALTHPDLVHFPSPANHRVGAIDEYDVRQFGSAHV